MKRFRLPLMVLLATLVCLPLTGCDDLTTSTGSVLKGMDVAYKGVMDGSSLAYKKGFISKDTLARVTCYATIYHSAWDGACTALEEYDKAANSDNAVDKEVKRIALDAAVALARNRLVELKTYWAEARSAYTELKGRHDE